MASRLHAVCVPSMRDHARKPLTVKQVQHIRFFQRRRRPTKCVIAKHTNMKRIQLRQDLRLRATDGTELATSDFDADGIPWFVLEGETFRTVSAGDLTMYFWEPALGLGSRLSSLLFGCAGLLGLSATASAVGVQAHSGEILLGSIGAGIGALMMGVLMLVLEFKLATGDSGEVHVLVGVPSEGPPVNTLKQIEVHDPLTLPLRLPGVQVKQADEGKGRGAFAVTSLPKRSYIGDYEGDLLSAAQLKSRFGETIGDYVHVIDSEWAIDAEGLARSSSSFTGAAATPGSL
eukprot:1195370-Prorocentrum_minimum.AAC.5